jgi:DNA-binding MarR family transcriptional regulator
MITHPARFAPNPDHKGSPHFVLTPKGRAMLAQLTEAAFRCHQRLADQFDESELNAIHHGLRRLVSALHPPIAKE